MKIYKIIILLALALGFLNSVNAQHETKLDAEFQCFCLVDSVSAGDQTQFWRKVFINTGLYSDHRFDWATTYTVSGTVIPCATNKVCGPYTPSLTNVTTADTIAANTVNSVSIAALSGTVTVQTGSDTAVTLDATANESISIPAADGCSLVPTQIIVTVSGGGNAHVLKSIQ